MELLKANRENLSMLNEMVNHFSEEEYTRQLAIISNATIGQHIRHILEFYECLIIGTKCGAVSYDKRKRKLQLEVDTEFTQNTISKILLELNSIDFNRPLLLKASFSTKNEGDLEVFSSSVARELAYCLEHTVHHLAILKIAVRETFNHIYMDENLGVAYSTIKYKKRECVQ